MKVQLTRDRRAAMARNLKDYLARQGIEIQHTMAVKAIAAMLGLDEHALAQAVKREAIELELPAGGVTVSAFVEAVKDDDDDPRFRRVGEAMADEIWRGRAGDEDD